MKKITAILLALVLVLAMSTSAMAATITVNGAEGETYTAYKIFDVTKSDTAISYSITDVAGTDDWFDVIMSYMGATLSEEADSYTGKGITLTKTTTENLYNVSVDNDSFDPGDFAKELAKHTTGKTGESGQIAEDATSVVIIVTDAGYYFVNSTLGSLCVLNTAAESVTVYEKNSLPTIAKQVKANDEENFADSTTAQFGQTVNYKLTVNTGTNDKNVNTKVEDGKEVNTDHAESGMTGVDGNYIVTDTLPTGVDYTEGTLAVAVGDIEWVENTDYELTVTGQVIEVKLLSTGKLNNIAEDTNIIITYDAIIRDDAAVATANTNTVVLKYKSQEATDAAVVYTYSFDFEKRAESATGSLLAEAEFKLFEEDKTTEIKVHEVSDGVYTVCDGTEDATAEDVMITPESGKIVVSGLGNGTYYLQETKAPAGYNTLTAMQVVVINNANNSEAIDVINNAGSSLPSTGGMGTTLFYVVGGMMMAAAVVLLVAKKKVSAK